MGEKRVDDIWRLTAERTTLRLAEFDAWNAADLDGFNNEEILAQISAF